MDRLKRIHLVTETLCSFSDIAKVTGHKRYSIVKWFRDNKEKYSLREKRSSFVTKQIINLLKNNHKIKYADGHTFKLNKRINVFVLIGEDNNKYHCFKLPHNGIPDDTIVYLVFLQENNKPIFSIPSSSITMKKWIGINPNKTRYPLMLVGYLGNGGDIT